MTTGLQIYNDNLLNLSSMLKTGMLEILHDEALKRQGIIHGVFRNWNQNGETIEGYCGIVKNLLTFVPVQRLKVGDVILHKLINAFGVVKKNKKTLQVVECLGSKKIDMSKSKVDIFRYRVVREGESHKFVIEDAFLNFGGFVEASFSGWVKV